MPEIRSASVDGSETATGRSNVKSSIPKLLPSAETPAYDDGWAHLGKVGKYISNNSSFSPVNYGYKKLSDLIRASELFEISKRDKGVLYIKSPEK